MMGLLEHASPARPRFLILILFFAYSFFLLLLFSFSQLVAFQGNRQFGTSSAEAALL